MKIRTLTVFNTNLLMGRELSVVRFSRGFVALLALLWLSVMFYASATQAHPSLTSEILLDVGDDSIKLTLIAPVHEWYLAAPPIDLTNQKPDTRVEVPAESQELILDYLQEHVSLTNEAGKAYNLLDSLLVFTTPAGNPHLKAELVYQSPELVTDNSFTLNWTAIVHRVSSHRATLAIASDTAANSDQVFPRLLGKLHYQETSVLIRR